MTSILHLRPCAKINLGLNVVSRRQDGYHDIETVFYPIPLCDELDVEVLSPDEGTEGCELRLEGTPLDADPQDNLIVRAYRLLADDFPLPPMRATLRKHIPMQAGLGGGSSDAAAMLNAVNTLCRLGLDSATLRRYAARLGADCAFFITSQPCFATGIGDKLTPISISLKGYSLLLVKPDDVVSTREAYADITPQQPVDSCRSIVDRPIEEWQPLLKNDFEASVMPKHPLIAEVRQRLQTLGADYVQMTGSGSVVYAISRKSLAADCNMGKLFPGCWWEELKLT